MQGIWWQPDDHKKVRYIERIWLSARVGRVGQITTRTPGIADPIHGPCANLLDPRTPQFFRCSRVKMADSDVSVISDEENTVLTLIVCSLKQVYSYQNCAHSFVI